MLHAIKMKSATFAMGCFWHPDALYGCQNGVLKTRVGYTSGKLLNPTYRNLGDHTEAIDIEYDPSVTNYETLLKLFWKNHDQTSEHKRQYRAVIFYKDEEQKCLAEKMKAEIAEGHRQKIVTSIEAFDKFYNAEDYHQKYYLQTHHPNLVKSLGLKASDLANSEVAAKLNGYVVGENTLESFNAVCGDFGLSSEDIDYVRKQIAKGKHSHC